MFKRFVARCLVGLQVYSSLFQGLAHANLTEHYPVRDEIYLHGSLHKDGGLQVALGTNAASGSELEVLGVIDVPAYKILKGLDRSATFFTRQSATYSGRSGVTERETLSTREDDLSLVDLDSKTAARKEHHPLLRSAWMDAPSYEPRIYKLPTPGIMPQSDPSSALEGLSPTLEAQAYTHSGDGDEKAGSVYGEDAEETLSEFHGGEASRFSESVGFSDLDSEAAGGYGLGAYDLEPDELAEVRSYKALRSISWPVTPPELTAEESSAVFGDHGPDHAEEAGEGEIVGFTKDDITRTSEGAHFFLQGLQVSMKDDGRIFVSGTQTDFSKPIFLSNESAIVLDNVRASTLQLTAPQIFSAGESWIDSLTLEGVAPDSVFINTGKLIAQEFFLKSLKSGNTGTITAPRFSVEGELESTGTLESDECILEESTFLRLVDGSRASIKTLFLSPNSHTENQITDEISIDVLDGLGGTLTNLGEWTVGEVAKGSTFQAILNRKTMAVMAGTVNTQNFENNGRWVAHSPLIVHDGKNAGTVVSSDLQVGSSFTNEESGVIVTPIVSGTGALENFGRLGNGENLEIGIREFTNNGSVKAKSITGSVTLEKLINADEKTIEATEDLSFTSSTQVINDGALVARQMKLVGEKTIQKGLLGGTSLDVSGVGEFENLGEITLTGTISLNLPRVINRGSVESASISGSESLTHLENTPDASVELQGGSLKTLIGTTVVNRGLITGGNYEFAGPKFSQRGTLRGKRLSLTGAGEFENRGNTEISELVTLGGLRFINRERLKAGEIKGLEALTHLENSFGAEIILQGARLRTEALTTVINDGLIVGGDYEFNGPGLLQRGTLKGKDLAILGRFEFENLGEIELSGLMTLGVLQFINSASIKARAITGTKQLTDFENTRDSSISLAGGTLTTANRTAVANHGTITGGAYDFAGPSLMQWGVLSGKSLKLAIDTEISTSDSQDLDISDSIDTFNILTPFVLRGTTKTARFSHIGVLELYGTLSVVEGFNGSGTIARSGKLYAGAVECEEDMKVLGEVETETIAAVKALAVNGKVKSKRSASVGGKLSVGAGGKVQGITGERLVLDLKGGAEIAGTVDTDHLTATKAVTVADKGQLLTQQSTTLIEGLAVAKGGIAQLKKLKVDGGTISNAGGLSVVGVEKGRVEINLSNEGIASIDGLNPIQVSVLGPLPVEADSLKMRLLNKPGGQLTLKSGKYDLTGERALLNQGVLIQEQASVQWSAPKLLHRINVGEWHISSVASLRNYSGEKMGKIFVNAMLFVWSQVDVIRALAGLSDLKTDQIKVYAPELCNSPPAVRTEKRYPWPLELELTRGVITILTSRHRS